MSQTQANTSKEETSLKNYETLLNTSMGMHGKCFPHEGHTPHGFLGLTYHDLVFVEQKPKSFLQVFN
jgi:hypothetical protein